MEDKIDFEPYGNAVAQWNENKQQWEIDLNPKDISMNRPLYGAVSTWLKNKGVSHTILQQRNNQLRVVAWRNEE